MTLQEIYKLIIKLGLDNDVQFVSIENQAKNFETDICGSLVDLSVYVSDLMTNNDRDTLERFLFLLLAEIYRKEHGYPKEV